MSSGGAGIQREPSHSGGSYSETAVVTVPGGRWIYVAAQQGVGHDGTAVEGGITVEADACFEGLRTALAGKGAHLSDVVKITVFLADIDDYAAYDAARRAAFGQVFPTSTTVEAARLLRGALIALDAIAFVPAEVSHQED